MAADIYVDLCHFAQLMMKLLKKADCHQLLAEFVSIKTSNTINISNIINEKYFKEYF